MLLGRRYWVARMTAIWTPPDLPPVHKDGNAIEGTPPTTPVTPHPPDTTVDDYLTQVSGRFGALNLLIAYYHAVENMIPPNPTLLKHAAAAYREQWTETVNYVRRSTEAAGFQLTKLRPHFKNPLGELKKGIHDLETEIAIKTPMVKTSSSSGKIPNWI